VAVGDFNGDGIPDLAVAGGNANGTVSVLLGKGDGTFLPAVNYPAGNGTVSVAVADFNGDGKQDLAVANQGTYPFANGSVNILLGQGDGTFLPAQSFPAGKGPIFVAVGDFNGDGVPDLTVVNYGDAFGNGKGVSVLLGKGDGTFLPAQSYAAGSDPRSVAVADLNGDGKQDLAVADYFGGVSVLLGKGDGTFLTATGYAAGTHPWSVAVGDFNADGIPDLAVANYGTYPYYTDGSVSILLGQGDGTFLTAKSYPAGIAPKSVAVGDFNGDGKQDLAVADIGDNYAKGQGVSVLLGQGDGSFLTAKTYVAWVDPYSVAVGDFNGDGKQDLAVANHGEFPYTNGNVSVLLGQGDGTFPSTPAFPAGTNPWSVAVGDFNGDGIPDLAVANENSDNVSVLLGKGDGTFLPAQTFDAGTHPRSVAVGDFNADGKLDLAVAGYGRYLDYYGNYHNFDETVRVLLGKGDGTFQPAVNYAAGKEPTSVAVGDFNGDGKQDLAVANYYSSGVSVLLGKGDGTFLPAQAFPAGTKPWSVAVGDFNGDGILDLAVANYTAYGNGTVSVLLGKGDGSFLPAVNYTVGAYPISVAVGDFNGDGFLDLAVANQGINGAGSVSVLLGKGDGTFLPAVNYAAGSYPNSVAVGDFNGDGIFDLAVAGLGGAVRVLLGKGDGTFQTTNVSYVAGTGSLSVAVGDFNGDGFPDLTVVNYGVSILLNDATWPGGPSRARGGPSHPPVPEPLPPPAVRPFPSGQEPRLATSALLSLPVSPGNPTVIAPPTPVALPGADSPPPPILAGMLWEGRPSALADPRAGPRARGAPWTLDHLFAELAANAVWDEGTDQAIAVLT
jgi:hypothetical protein